MSSNKPRKAGVAEIFAAVRGVMTEGKCLSEQGIKINDHALVKLAADAASDLWDAKYKAAVRPLNLNEDQEHFVQPLVRLLKKSMPVLMDNITTGKVALVRAHIESILEREAAPEARAIEKFRDGGIPVSAFKAEYLAKASDEVSATPDVGEELDIAQELEPSKTAARITGKRGRKPRGESAAPAFVPA